MESQETTQTQVSEENEEKEQVSTGISRLDFYLAYICITDQIAAFVIADTCLKNPQIGATIRDYLQDQVGKFTDPEEAEKLCEQEGISEQSGQVEFWFTFRDMVLRNLAAATGE